MTNIYGDGYEAATEPGPDVEYKNLNGSTWRRREFQESALSPFVTYRRPIKLREGETYGCRNSRLANPSRDSGNPLYPWRDKSLGLSWKDNGRLIDEHEISDGDIIEHIPKQPKEKLMNEQTITVNNVTLTHDQVQEAYDKMVKAKAENEIKVGDWVVHKDGFILKVVGISGINISTKGWSYSKNYCEKLHPTQEQKAWLDSLIGGVE